MRPAFSVILLTTLIGAGQGLFLALYLVELAARTGAVPPVRGNFYAAGSALVVLLMVLGLVASVFHLGRPERGWRAAARWRTSWLSREIIVLPLFTAGAFFYGLAHWLLPAESAARTTMALGAVTAVLSVALYVCTGMIYACLKFLQEWATPLTVVNYTLLGLASGFTLATAYAAYAAAPLAAFVGPYALILTAAALLARGASLARNARLRSVSTLQTAIGIRHPRIVQTSMGMMGGAFNTREFFHGRARTTLLAFRWLFLIFAFLLPAALLAAGLAWDTAALLAAAFAVQYPGVLAERWFFFAEVRHPQNLYYQAVA